MLHPPSPAPALPGTLKVDNFMAAVSFQARLAPDFQPFTILSFSNADKSRDMSLNLTDAHFSIDVGIKDFQLTVPLGDVANPSWSELRKYGKLPVPLGAVSAGLDVAGEVTGFPPLAVGFDIGWGMLCTRKRMAMSIATWSTAVCMPARFVHYRDTRVLQASFAGG